MTDAILIRTDADKSTGFGHLMRCLSLAAELRKRRKKAVFAFAGLNHAARSLGEWHGYPYFHLPRENLAMEARQLRARGSELPQALILDLSHQYTLANSERVPAYVGALRELVGLVVMLDGFGDESVAGRVSELEIDVLVVPYVGAETDRHVPAGVRARLAGPRYFVFSPTFQKWGGKKRSIRRRADRLLLTFGGTDPSGVTLKALSAANLIVDRRLQIRVIVGPGFEERLARRIRDAAVDGSHSIEIVPAPECLASHFRWCDLAVSGSGLTKYELALTGTPSIQLCINEAHARANKVFARAGTAADLGLHGAVTARRLAIEIQRVLDDFECRKEMSRRGLVLADGRGAERVISELLRKQHVA